MPITTEQCIAGRLKLGITRSALAKLALLGETTIGDLERGDHHPSLATLSKIEEAFRKSGLEFLPDGTPVLTDDRSQQAEPTQS